jgi:uncharacterized repeat protein (TIGR01451 family)
MNFIKNIFKAIAVLALAFAATSAFAGSVNENAGNFPTFMTTDQTLSNSTWRSSVSISPGELLSFRMHYYLQEGDSTSNMRFSMENLNNKTFNAGDSEKVSGTVSASGLSSASGSVTVNFTDDVKLNLYNVSWQKVGCTSVGCETPLVDSASNILTSSGMSIGSVEGYTNGNWQGKHYAGDVVVSFRVQSNGDTNPEPSDDIEVKTNSASSIEEDSARLNGEVEEGDNVEVWFALSRNSNPSCTNSSDREDVSGGDRDSGDDFSVKVDDLRENTKYYFRACGENNDGLDSGNIKSFTTDDEDNGSDDIEVTTNSATNIEDNSARLRGELEEGDDAEVWFAIASEFESSPSCSNSSQREEVNGTYDRGDDFFLTVSGLDDDTRYYFRACAEDDNGDDSGEVKNFETDGNGSDNGEISTLSPTSITDDSARLNGRVEEGDDLEVWFALSRTDSTPSCSSSSQKEDVSGKFDDGESFSRVVTNLRENSTYYYRACGEDEDGEDVFGSIRTFVTGGGSTNLQSAITGGATNVGTVSATVNGVVTGSGSGECYFNFGTTTNIPLKTSDRSVSGSDTCNAFLSGLSPNTIYFYQTVLERDGVVRKGAIRSFRTDSNLPPVIINNPPTNPNPGTTIIRIVDRVNQNEEDLGVTKWVSGEFDDNFVTAIEAQRGEVVFYRVLVRNNTDETLEDIVVTDRIPFELELADNDDIDDDSDKQLIWDIDELRPGESRIFITEMRVREDTPVGLEIVSYASAESDEFQTDSNNVLIEVEGGIFGQNNQGASVFGAGFFPDSLIGWLILIAILIAIAYLISRLLFSRKESYKLNAELAAMEAERMRNLR